MNKPFLKFCNSLDYNSYSTLENVFFWTNCASVASNLFLIGAGDVARNSVLAAMILTDVAYMFLRYSGGKYYTRDIVIARKLYEEFLANYTKINKEFDFNDPISMLTLYNYMRCNGYLSKDKRFEYLDSSSLDVGTLFGVDVLTGYGVCRHISSMFTDVLNFSGVEAITASCYLREKHPMVGEVDKEHYDREMVIDVINKCILDENEKRRLLDCIADLEENDLFLNVYFAFEPAKKTGEKANHAITCATYNGINYYLDPTQERIYRLKDGKIGILYDRYDDKIRVKSCTDLSLNGVWNPNTSKTVKKLFFAGDNISLDEEKQIIEDTKRICLDNIDMFESFYRENRDLYGEIINASKRVMVRKRGR